MHFYFLVDELWCTTHHLKMNSILSNFLMCPLFLCLVASLHSISSTAQQPTISKASTISSLAGPDANNNGIRDDIDNYLTSLKLDGPKLKAAEQLAKVYQSQITVKINDKGTPSASEGQHGF